MPEAEHPAFDSFVNTVAALRSPQGGCPWNRAQTHASIGDYMIEEAYEAVDAIQANSADHLCEELGDVLLQVVLHSQMAADAGEFTIDDVCVGINEKMIRRHPHVFGDAKAANANEVADLWEQVKLAEKGASGRAGAGRGASAQAAAEREGNASTRAASAQDGASARADAAGRGASAQVASAQDGASARADAAQDNASARADAEREGLLDAVPTHFPALLQCQKISRKAAAAGFEWETVEDVWEKVAEERVELDAAYAAAPKTPDGKVLSGDPAESGMPERDPLVVAAEMEFGDLLFALVNVARKMGIDAEAALRASNAKFRRRWANVERAAWAQGREVEDLTLDEMEARWQEAKRAEKGSE